MNKLKRWRASRRCCSPASDYQTEKRRWIAKTATVEQAKKVAPRNYDRLLADRRSMKQ